MRKHYSNEKYVIALQLKEEFKLCVETINLLEIWNQIWDTIWSAKKVKLEKLWHPICSYFQFQ